MQIRVPSIEPDRIDQKHLYAYFGDCVEVDVAARLILTKGGTAMSLGRAEDVAQDIQRAIGFVRREMRRDAGAEAGVREPVDSRLGQR
ncbi:hypothetical protein [Gordonia sp. (in: high G+C Gram-positive bacteria)]|uniref:hypothetical protein n=1 Tax=Gordonia sp. (in: high G+C Gram-positive bacteria) TaxID=84139 RepID=UPI003C72FA93